MKKAGMSTRNKTQSCTQNEIDLLSDHIFHVNQNVTAATLCGKIVNGDIFDVAPYFPTAFVDLLILDPPYNLSKDYNGYSFKQKDRLQYSEWFENVIQTLKPTLKPTATIYVCSDWKSSMLIAPILEKNFQIRNRITWERDKGRGAKTNWKNNIEDIWYCTVSNDFYFDVDSVKLKKKVIAPYKENGKPKDWKEELGDKYRLTHPSNIWTDITIPFWSMAENTSHPTQKPEKLLAKLILASSKKNDLVFDPFLGSGSTAVVSKKLGRRYLGVELNKEYCCWAIKRLLQAEKSMSIQGYSDGVFRERNAKATLEVSKLG